MTGEGEMQSVPPDDSDGQQITWAKTGVSIGRIWFSWSSSQSVSFKYGWMVIHVCVCVGGFMCVPLFLFVCWKLLGYSSKKPSVYKETMYKEHLEY